MKKISLFLVSCFLIQSLAWAGPKDSLKQVLDEYRYFVTVEWDQQDQAQFNQAKEKFATEFSAIVEENNLSGKDIQNFLKENARDLKLNEATLASLEDANGKLNVERAQELLHTNASSLYQQGAAWTALDMLKWGIGILVAFEIVVLILNSRDDKCPYDGPWQYDVTYECVYEQ